MRLDELFKKKEANEEKINNANKKTQIPKIIFKNRDLEKNIARWLEEKTSVQEGFGKVLSQIGFSSNDTIILDDYNQDDFSFSCSTKSIPDIKKRISLKYGNYIDDFSEITLTSDEVEKNYEYIYSPDSGLRVRQHHYSKKNTDNGNLCYRCLFPYSYYIIIKNSEYNFLVDVEIPDNLKKSPCVDNDHPYRLKNEEALEQYLLSLSFPIAIDEVYKKICELSLDPVNLYPRLILKVRKKIDDNKTMITDSIIMEQGQISSFIITRNDKTISLNNLEDWTYEAPEISAISKDGLDFFFKVHVENREQLSKTISPIEEFDKISDEVEQVRKLKKSLIQK